MEILNKWKFLVIIAALILSAWFLYPTIRWYSQTDKDRTNLSNVDYDTWKSLNEHKLNLGLDLQGGVSLLLKIDTVTLEQMALDREVERINNEFEKKQYIERATLSPDSSAIIIPYPDADHKTVYQKIATENSVLLERQTAAKNQLEYIADARQVNQRIKDTMDQARRVIENRINGMGVSETMVSMVGNDRLAVEIPGETDPAHVTEIIKQQAFLEFKLVGDESLLDAIINEHGELRPGAVIPDGYELKYLTDVASGENNKKPLLIKRHAEMTGDHITSAMVARDQMSMGAPYVELTLDNQGSRIFENVTGNNVGKRLAIVLDGEVKSAPVIQDRIPNGQARITGQFTEDQARDLALVLKAGALPAPLIVEESRTVGPSLGLDSIRKGVLSSIIAGILVIVFMLIYYKGSGAIADLALILNLILLVASLAALHATLTVPGIAGVILTIGMAVDANVLIFERIREELRSGKTPRAAIEAGYDRAFHAIFDSNMTTIIASFMLYEFGRGAVRGFAVTLGVGIAINLFTAVFVTKVIFDKISLRQGFKKISI